MDMSSGSIVTLTNGAALALLLTLAASAWIDAIPLTSKQT
jgi:hypothetical protein